MGSALSHKFSWLHKTDPFGEAAAVDSVRCFDHQGHCAAGAQALSKAGNVGKDEGLTDTFDANSFPSLACGNAAWRTDETHSAHWVSLSPWIH